VIRSGRRTLAVVALGGGRFEPRDIVLGLQTDDGWSEVLEGLDPGERVVVSSQFLIDSESRLQDAIRKLRSEREAWDEGASEDADGEATDHDATDHDAMDHDAMDHETMDHGSMGEGR
jgi:hypothetical protein